MASSTSANGVDRPENTGRLRTLPPGLSKTFSTINTILTWLCSALMVGMFVVVIVAVFCRYVLNSSLLWGEELARYVSIWMICLGLGVAHRYGAHVAVNSALAWVPGLNPRVVKVVSEVATLILCVLITWFSWLAASANFRTGQTSPAMGIEIAWIYLAIPLGFLLMSIQSVIRIIAPDETQDEEEVV